MCLGVDERGMGQNGGMGRRPAFCLEGGSVAWGKRKREGGSGGHIRMEEGGEGGGVPPNRWMVPGQQRPKAGGCGRRGEVMLRGRPDRGGGEGVDRWATTTVLGDCVG
jgi:hypothetical protein